MPPSSCLVGAGSLRWHAPPPPSSTPPATCQLERRTTDLDHRPTVRHRRRPHRRADQPALLLALMLGCLLSLLSPTSVRGSPSSAVPLTSLADADFRLLSDDVEAAFNLTASSFIGLDARLVDLVSGVDHGWVYVTSVLIFFMQAGFALLEAGSVGSKDIISILLKNFTDFAISSIAYWLVGYSFHYGSTPFIGVHETALFATDDPKLLPRMFQSTMFCATSVTIVSGAIACRFSFHAYIVLCVIFSAFIYPITASWIWGSGFLCPTALGAIDFAGSGVVHLQGATIAMTACLFVGPRLGRFITDPVTGKITPSSDFNGNSIVLTALGTLILFTGWFGFNAGSTGGLSGGRHLVAGVAAVNTTLAASSALLTGLFLTKFMEKTYNMWQVLNSTLAGLVAITAACATVGPGPAIGIGVLAAFTYHFTNLLVLSRGIDDVVGAFSVHGTPGAVGLICTGLFSRQDYIDLAFGRGVLSYSPGRQLGVQLLQVVCTFAWSAASSSLVLWCLTRTIGIRVSSDDEIVGLDFVLHQGYAYETHNKRMLRAKKQIEREQILGQKLRRAVNNITHQQRHQQQQTQSPQDGNPSEVGSAHDQGAASDGFSRSHPTHHRKEGTQTNFHANGGGASMHEVSLHGKKMPTHHYASGGGGGGGLHSGLHSAIGSVVGGGGRAASGVRSMRDHTATHVAIHVHGSAGDESAVAGFFHSDESPDVSMDSNGRATFSSPDQSRIRSQRRGHAATAAAAAAHHHHAHHRAAPASHNHDAFHASTSDHPSSHPYYHPHPSAAADGRPQPPHVAHESPAGEDAPNQSVPDDMLPSSGHHGSPNPSSSPNYYDRESISRNPDDLALGGGGGGEATWSQSNAHMARGGQNSRSNNPRNVPRSGRWSGGSSGASGVKPAGGLIQVQGRPPSGSNATPPLGPHAPIARERSATGSLRKHASFDPTTAAAGSAGSPFSGPFAPTAATAAGAAYSPNSATSSMDHRRSGDSSTTVGITNRRTGDSVTFHTTTTPSSPHAHRRIHSPDTEMESSLSQGGAPVFHQESPSIADDPADASSSPLITGGPSASAIPTVAAGVASSPANFQFRFVGVGAAAAAQPQPTPIQEEADAVPTTPRLLPPAAAKPSHKAD